MVELVLLPAMRIIVKDIVPTQAKPTIYRCEFSAWNGALVTTKTPFESVNRTCRLSSRHTNPMTLHMLFCGHPRSLRFPK